MTVTLTMNTTPAQVIDSLEDELCHETDIDTFEAFMVELKNEMVKRYGDNPRRT